MKAIVTRYLRETRTKPSRIVAEEMDGSRITASYHTDASAMENHERAARELCDKLGWHGTLQSGHAKFGQVWVFIDQKRQIHV